MHTYPKYTHTYINMYLHRPYHIGSNVKRADNVFDRQYACKHTYICYIIIYMNVQKQMYKCTDHATIGSSVKGSPADDVCDSRYVCPPFQKHFDEFARAVARGVVQCCEGNTAPNVRVCTCIHGFIHVYK